ncbi:O-fucosyltransferase 36 [Datura stramonium]|uniref:GDP-fucose protein O-fucosyltransferase 2 n=1 Tax=Datura stramonium TaxID=4076 RepID=A0ABS8V0T3_DATST|nr:O-fucosyltransferase 36 [Datura stramonium]
MAPAADIEDEIKDEKNPPPLDEDDIALLKTYTMEREPFDEEEEDQQNLIAQSERRNNHFESPVRTAFQIDDVNDETASPRRFNFSFSKWYFFAIIVPVLILILYFTTDVDNFFRTGVVNANYDVSVNRMRESELRALYLLRQQQLGLFKLSNSTLLDNSLNATSNKAAANNSDFVSTFSFSSALFEELKLDLLSQISLNKQIQQALLSSHQLGNLLNASDNVADSSLDDYGGLHRCRKMDYKLSDRQTIEWKPRLDKYLFAICVSGQMSNHLICLEKHMFFAALLNRILIIPSSRVDYEFRRVLDIDHINKCLGRKVVVPFEEFAKSQKGHMHIDKFICYFSRPQPCFLDDEHVKKLSSLGVSMNKLETAWDEDVKNPKPRTVQDIMTKFSLDDDVIAIGDVFFANVEKKWVMQPGGPVSHKCKTLVEPSRLILLTAQRFIQTFLGENFIALHFRRHGFLKFCNAKKPSCFYPVPQAADCINRAVERSTAPVIYLSTDAAESETGLLQSLVVVNGKTVPLVRRPARNSDEKWDALLYRHGFEGDRQVEAMLDKTICAMSDVFIGSMGSTFTEDILRLRKDWGSASLCDEYLCQGEIPNFIADDE